MQKEVIYISEIRLKTSVTYKGTGSQTQYDFPFDYLRKSFIKVTIDDVLQDTSDYIVDNRSILFNTAPAADSIIVIYRETDTERLVSWADASVLKASDMTISQVQQLHILEEGQDWSKLNSLYLDETDKSWEGNNHKIKNVSYPVNDDDVVTKGYMETVQGGFVMTNTALKDEATKQAGIATTKASEAAASASAAATSETNAASSANTAKRWAEASDSPDNTTSKSAKTWASEASTSASAAKASEINAKSSETNAKSSETKAANSATTATEKAGIATTKASEASASASAAKTSETNAQNAAQSAYDDGKALIEANVQAAANSASAALSSEQSSILNASNASVSELNAKNSAERAREIAEGIGNPVVDVTEANGVVTVKKSNAAMNSFGLIKTVNDTPPDENGNVNVAAVPIGFEYFSMNPNIPAGSIPLFGGEYSRTTYSDLWNWVQEQPNYLLTEEEWQAKASANDGNVPYYSSGDGSTTFRVPSLKCWVKGANGIEEVGSYLQAGLPNIKGEITSEQATHNGVQMIEPKFAGALTGKEKGAASWNGNVNGSYNVYFDASRSNPIYGNSDTVQPKSIVGMWLVKAYGTVTNVGSTDVADIAQGLTELETRASEHANKNLSNLSDIGKETAISLNFPDWSKAIIISAFPFTVPCRGYFLNQTTSGAPGSRIIYADGVVRAAFTGANSGGPGSSILVPLRKNEVLTSNASIWGTYYFLPIGGN